MPEAISRSRLLQIAQRKLAALGIPFRAEGEEIRGDLVTGAYGLRNPATGARIESVRFEVEGHDRLRFLEPAFLRDMAAQPFYDQENVGAIVNQLASTLERRFGAAQAAASRLRTLGFDVTVDPDRLVATVRIELPGQGTAVLEGTEKGVVAARVLAPPGSIRPVVSMGNVPVDLREFPDRVDLELHVSTLADAALAAADVVAASPATSGRGGAEDPAIFASLGEIHASDDSLDGMRYFAGMTGGAPASFASFSVPGEAPAPPPYAAPAALDLPPRRPAAAAPPVPAAVLPGIPLDALARAFGEGTVIAGNVVVTREVRHAGQRLQFAAQQDGPRTFLGRISGPTGVIAELHFDLDGFPGVEAAVAQRLAQLTPASAPPPYGPVPGQVWVMDVRVDGEDAAGIRYTMLNARGSPAGSPKALRRPEFEATFAIVGGKPRLLARVIEVAGVQVGYVQLDPRRQPVGGTRRSSLTTFTGTFRPEA